MASSVLKPRSEVKSPVLSPTYIKGKNISWKNIGFSVDTIKGRKDILKGCSGRLPVGVLACIMGPSGSGKTSLMNVLAGRIGDAYTGSVSLNGKDVRPSQLKKSVAYVMQEDALFATQTPREALHFSATLRLPKTVTVDERHRIVSKLLKDLDIEKCADTLIGSILIRGISGGEKRRVSIGIELISEPRFLFLDEPTSGLDTVAAYNVVQVLRNLSRKSNCGILATIHQPSSEIFHAFDTCTLLESGEVFYHGKVKDIGNYFESVDSSYKCPENHNVADHIMFLMNTKESVVKKLHEAWKSESKKLEHLHEDLKTIVSGESKAGLLRNKSMVSSVDGASTVELKAKENTDHKDEGEERHGFWVQLWHLTVRDAKNTIRDKKTLKVRYGLTIFLNIIYGLVFLDSGDSPSARFGGIFQLSLTAMFSVAQPLTINFPYERPPFLREYLNNSYGVLPYFFSKFLVEIPLVLVQTLLSVLLAFFMMDLQGNFFLLWMGLFLLGIVASSVAIFLGCAATDVKGAIEALPGVLVPQMLFSGFLIRINEIPAFIRWAQYLCFLKYGLNILILTEFDENKPEEADIINDNDIDPDDLGLYVMAMFLLLLTFRSLAIISICMKGQKLH